MTTLKKHDVSSIRCSMKLRPSTLTSQTVGARMRLSEWCRLAAGTTR